MESLEKPQIITHIEKSLNYTVFDVKWVPCSAKVVVLGSHPRDTGALQVYEIAKGELKLVLESEKKHSFKCGTFGAASLHKRRIATGDFGGRLSIWDLDRIEAPVYSVKAHDQIVNTIDGVGGLGIGGGAPEIVTGSRDGSVKVWDARQQEEPVACMEPAKGEVKRDCWTVAFGNSFSDTDRCVCAGYDNGDIKLFDLRTMTQRWETNIKNGVCFMEFDRKDIPMNKLVVTTLEAKFNVYDLRTQHPTKGFACLTEKVCIQLANVWLRKIHYIINNPHWYAMMNRILNPIIYVCGMVPVLMIHTIVLFTLVTVGCQVPSSSTLWCVRHLPQNRDVFMTSAGSGAVHLWKYSYPDSRVKKDSEGRDEGVMGSVSLLQNVTLAPQPISSMDWNADKEGLLACCSFDQTVRICIVTRLNRI